MLTTEVNSDQIAAWGYVLLMLAGLLIGTAAQAGTYRWTDEAGGVVYSQTPPPPGIEAEIVDDPPPPAESPEVARERLEQRIQKFETDRAQRLESQQQAAEQKTKAQREAVNCAAARHNLDIYADAPPNRLYKDDTGIYRRFSEDERNAKAQTAREAIEKYCK